MVASSLSRLPPFLLVLLASSSMFQPQIIHVVALSIEKSKLLAVSQVSGTHVCPVLPFCDVPVKEARQEADIFLSYGSFLEPAYKTCRNGGICSLAAGTAATVDECETDENLYYEFLDDFVYNECLGDDNLYYNYTGVVSYSRGSPHVLFFRPVIPVWLSLVYSLLAFFSLFSWITTWLLWWCRRNRDREEQPNEELGRGGMAPRRYRYREVAAATSNFAESRRIGRGGFGAVYQGFLSDARHHVAVKVLWPDFAAQGRKEFEAEVKIIGRLRHRNLVQLLGWCDGSKGLFLIYELVPEGSLDKHLHGPGRLLNWTERYKIALDLGAAVLYLHTECEQCVVHGDIKPSNVMLDASRTAKLGDFGLARLVDHGAEPQTTEVVAGTVGYIDPEFVDTRRPSTESDVYSFGVVLLEIACGRPPTAGGAPALLRRVRDMYDRNAVLDAADERLNGEFDRQQTERVLITGLWCAHRHRGQRPTIAQAMASLRSEDAGLPVLRDLHGPGPIRHLEEMAYGEVPSDASESMRSSVATLFHTPEDSGVICIEQG